MTLPSLLQLDAAEDLFWLMEKECGIPSAVIIRIREFWWLGPVYCDPPTGRFFPVRR